MKTEHNPVTTIALAGDVMLGRGVDEITREKGFAWPWGNLLPQRSKADLFFANLECALTKRTEKWTNGSDKPFHFRADPAAVESLAIGGVSGVSIANNHIADYGMAGLLDTIAALDGAGIAHAGAGHNLAAARAPARLEVNGHRVAVVAFADYPEAWAATADSAGINYTPIATDADIFAPVAAAIAEARQGSDIVVFSIHWGPNMRVRPPMEFRDFAQRVTDSGADIFWGHSAHVLQGIGCRDHKLILYDTGNLIDDYAVDPQLRNDLSALFVVRAAANGIQRLDLVPVRIHEMQATLATGADRLWIERRIKSLSNSFGTLVAEGPGGPSVIVTAPPADRVSA